MLERQTRILGGGRGNGKTFAMLSSVYDYVTREHGVTAAVICMHSQNRDYTTRMYIELVRSGDVVTPRIREGMVEHSNKSKVIFIVESQEEHLRGVRPGMVAINKPDLIHEFLRSYQARFPQADILLEIDDSQVVEIDSWTNFKWGRSILDV